jgi:ubiquitin-activating enzyme E1
MDTGASSSADREFDNEYSRLIHAIGKDTLLKMKNYKILLCGLAGVGLEVAKNLLLTGVKSLTISDDVPVTSFDLSTNFYLTNESIGKKRSEASLSALAELNERVKLDICPRDTIASSLANYNILVLTDNHSKTELLELNKLCRDQGVGFVVADSRGLFGSIFVDFGPSFESADANGERPINRLLELITQDEKPLVNVISGDAHDLQDGATVQFSDVEGMVEINGQEGKVEVVSPYSFKVDIDTSKFSAYKDRGRITEIKKKTVFEFESLSDSWTEYKDAKTSTMDFMKDMTVKPLFYLYYQALLTFQEKHGGDLPRSYHDGDASEILATVESLNKDLTKVEEVPADLIKKLSFVARGDLPPVACALGGIVAQEVMKHAGSKFTPLNQWLFFDALEALGSELPSETDVALTNTRYDGQIAVFGKPFVDRLRRMKYFCVGSGAIGCEILKNWAMMGVGSLDDGTAYVTDMDTIEISNLNRQFLYRAGDVGGHKSECAAKAVKKMNPDLNIVPYTNKVAEETEDIFNEDFWGSLDGVQNALDNVPARLYVDTKCIFFNKPLLEPGTLGPKGNVQVIVPGMTESYGSSPDPPQKETPICLLHAFPNNIEHCLQWARELLFEGYFTKDAEITNNFLTQDKYLDSVSGNPKKGTLETLEKTILSRPKTFADCVAWARDTFEKHYFQAASQILFTFPVDYVDDKGHKFWSGAKRPPTPFHFDVNNDTHLDFVTAAAVLRAYMFGIVASEIKGEGEASVESRQNEVRKVVASLPPVAEFKPKVGVKIETDENAKDAPAETSDDDEQYVMVMEGKLSSMPPPAKKSFKQLNIVDFEKDDDNNFHIDFIHAAANLRAVSHKIDPVERLQCRLIAGRIIPAMITTTALVAGLSSLEMYKLNQTPKLPLEAFSNSFANLAISMYAQSDPQAPPKYTYRGKELTLWDRIEIKEGDVTLSNLVSLIEEREGMEIDMIGIGKALIYFSWMSAAKRKERMGQKMSTIVEEVTKQPLKGYVLVATVTGTIEGEEIENMPDVYIYLK